MGKKQYKSDEEELAELNAGLSGNDQSELDALNAGLKKKEQSTGGDLSASSDLSQLSGNTEQPQPTESTESESVITLPLIGQVRVGQNSAKFNLPDVGEVEVEKDFLTGNPVFKELPKSDPNKLPAHLQNSGAAYVQANVEKQQQEKAIAAKQKVAILERKEGKEIADFYNQNIEAAPGNTPEEKTLYVSEQYKKLKTPELQKYRQQEIEFKKGADAFEKATGINANPIFRHKGEFKEEAQQLEYQNYADALRMKDIALKQRAENAAKLAGDTYYDPTTKAIKSRNIEKYSKNIETLNAIAEKEQAGQPPTPEEIQAFQTALAENTALESDGQFQQALAETQQYYADFDKNQQDSQQLINKFPELQRQLNYERIKRIADQNLLDVRKQMFPVETAAYENIVSPAVRGAVTFADGLNGLPRTLAADNEYGWTDALAGLSTDMVSDVYDATAVSPEKDTRGELTWSNLVPKTVELLTNMVPMVAGGYIGGAGKLAGAGSRAGVVAAAFVQNNKSYYDEALAANMTPAEASVFAISAAAQQASLELIAPPGLVNPISLQRAAVRGYVDAIARGVSKKQAYKVAGKIMVNALFKEEAQELSQLVNDKLNRFAANELAGAEFENTEITSKEVFETVVLTAIATGIFTGAPIAKTGVSGFTSYLERNALLEAASNSEYFVNEINRRVANGEFSPEEGKYLAETIADFGKKLQALPEDISPENKANILALQYEKMKLERLNAQEGIDEVFQKRNKEKIKLINEEIARLAPEGKEEITIQPTAETETIPTDRSEEIRKRINELKSTLPATLEEQEKVVAEIAALRKELTSLQKKPAEATTETVQTETGKYDLYHTGDTGLTIETISTDPRKTRQGKSGKYGGFYTYENIEDINEFAAGNKTKTKYGITLNPGVEITDYTGSIERLTKEKMDELRASGIQVIRGKSLVGKTEIVVLDKSAIKSIEEIGTAQTEAVAQTPQPKIVAPVTPKQEEQPTPQRPKLDRRGREKELLKRKPKILSDQQKKETQLLDKFDSFNQLTASNRKSAAGQQKLQKIINEAESLGYTVKPNQFYQLSFEGQKPKRSASETKSTLIDGYRKLTKRDPDIQEKYGKIADAFHAQGDFFFKGVDLGDLNINDIEGAIFDIDNNIGSYRAQEFLDTIERFSKENDVPFFNGTGVSFDEFMRLATEPMTKEVSAISFEPGSDWEAELLAQGVTQDELNQITQFLYEEQQEERSTKKGAPKVEGGTGLGTETGSEQEAESGGTVNPPNKPKKPRFEEPEEGEQRERQFAAKRKVDQTLDRRTRKNIAGKAINYFRKENEMTAKQAAGFVDDVGLDVAEEFLLDKSNNETPSVMIAIGSILMRRFEAKIKATESEEEKLEWAERSADVAEAVSERLTTLGQGVQAAAMFKRLTPEGLLITVQRAKAKAAKAVNEKYAAASQKTKEQFNEAVQNAGQKTVESAAVEKQLNSLVEKELQRREAAKKKTAEKLEELKKKFKDKGPCQ